ncbi:MAG: RagB/SusD family nutrient uptake outer membrane protein [Chitinophagaceae bacterium]
MKFKKLLFVVLIAASYSCKKFLEIDPPKNLISNVTVFSSDETAIAAVRGIYSQMINNIGGFASGGSFSVTFLCGLSADELNNHSNNYIALYRNALTSTNFPSILWSEPYKFINNANAVIEGLTRSTDVSDVTKRVLLGEAKFIRAFCHFYLVNLFGDVPLITTTDYSKNAVATRTPKNQVYEQIISDLKEAENLLLDDFSFSNGERDQPNKWAAVALLARVYLYTGDYVKAEAQATMVINNLGAFSLESDLNSIFLKNSSETIWQLKPIGTTLNTNEGNLFILTTAPNFVSLSLQLLNSFEPGDSRMSQWVKDFTIGSTTYYYPFKYKIKTGGSPFDEYSMVLRLAEQYLIRSEARAQQNNIAGGQADLNVIRFRAGLGPTNSNDKNSLLAAILKERQVELFTEWGHRWLDIKRTGNVDAIMVVGTTHKGGTWNTNQKWYPIPQSELQNDINLVQNPGY